MADVKIPKSIPCQFDAKGWDPCKKPSDNGWCSKHEGLQCSSCGEQAVRNCDSQRGGLGCGASLCATCEHGPEGNHITKEAGDEIRRQECEEREARAASRTNPEQRMNEKFGVPATLFELLKGDWREAGYDLKKIYFLELKHGLMGFFPAIFSLDEKRMIFTSDLQLLERVWLMLEPREATLRELTGYVNEKLGILYIETEYPEQREDQEPERILTTEEFNNLSEEEEPFKWASGLIGTRVFTEKNVFHQNLVIQASSLDPSFKSCAIG